MIFINIYRRKNLNLTCVMSVLLLLLGLIFGCNTSSSGDYVGSQVWDSDYEINSESDVETLAGYTSILGDLDIIETSLTNIDNLVFISHIEGSLRIKDNPSLSSLEGLNNLISVGNGLHIVRNDSLTNLEGLNNLTSVGVDMAIRLNPSLTSLEGFNSLISVGNDFYIYGNQSLTSLSLSNLCIAGRFSIKSNYELCTDLAEDLRNQVQACDGIADYIRISDNKTCP